MRTGLRPQWGRNTSQVYCDGRGWWSQSHALPDHLVLCVKQHKGHRPDQVTRRLSGVGRGCLLSLGQRQHCCLTTVQCPLYPCVCMRFACLGAQSCLTLCDPMYCSPSGSFVHGILQARLLEWVAMPSSRGSSQPRDQIQISRTAHRFFTD